MKTQTFEEFLGDVHFERNPQILDDDLTDAFNDWLGELQIDALIKLGDIYGISQFTEGIKRSNEAILDIRKSLNKIKKD